LRIEFFGDALPLPHFSMSLNPAQTEIFLPAKKRFQAGVPQLRGEPAWT
jgi:hypothetical protein